MAWTDQCKIDAKVQIEKRKAEVGGVVKAMRQLAKESGIPYDTLNYWYYERKREKIADKTDSYVGEKPPTQVLDKIEQKAIEFDRAKQHHERMQVFVETPLPVGSFAVLYVDPPWRYEYSASAARSIEQDSKYLTMDLESICNIKIQPICAENAILFMWATSPKLEEALRVINRWGFEYRTNMVWVKDRIGMGYYARQQHELLLISRKGKPPTPEPSNRPSSIISAPRLAHSEKPKIVYELIEQMYPGPADETFYCELFARDKREGWSVFGNEIP